MIVDRKREAAPFEAVGETRHMLQIFFYRINMIIFD